MWGGWENIRGEEGGEKKWIGRIEFFGKKNQKERIKGVWRDLSS